MGLKNSIGYDETIHRFNLAYASAHIVSGLADLNVKTAFTGQTGDGKSIGALNYCYGTACELSIINHGDKDEWEEYFNKDNMAIILSDEMLALASRFDPPGTVKFFDEIQEEVADNREYKNPKNRRFNKLYRLMRPRRHVVASTLQEIGEQDKHGRHKHTFYVEMTSMHAYEYGVNFCKIKVGSLRSLDPGDPIRYILPLIDGIQYPIDSVLLPPPKIFDAYRVKRQQNEKASDENEAKRTERMEEIQRIKEDAVLYGRSNKATEIQNALIDNPSLSGEALSRMFKCSPGYARSVKNKLGFNSSSSLANS